MYYLGLYMYMYIPSSVFGFRVRPLLASHQADSHCKLIVGGATVAGLEQPSQIFYWAHRQLPFSSLPLLPPPSSVLHPSSFAIVRSRVTGPLASSIFTHRSIPAFPQRDGDLNSNEETLHKCSNLGAQRPGGPGFHQAQA